MFGELATYNANTGALIGKIGFKQAVQSIAVAADGDVYVATNDFHTDTKIFVIRPGASRPYLAFAERPGNTVAIAVSTSGELAVLRETPSFTKLIDFFDAGAKVPTRTVTPTWDVTSYETYGPDGSLWLDGYTTTYVVGVIPPGGTAITTIPFAPTPEAPPLLFDHAGNLLLAESGRLVAYTQAGRPAYMLPLLSRPRNVDGIALGLEGQRIFLCDPNLQIESHRFPAGGLPQAAFGSYANSIAVGTIPGLPQ